MPYYLVENWAYPKADIQGLIDNELTFETLILKGIVYPKSSDSVQFSYVGVIGIRTDFIVVLPKYIAIEDEVNKSEKSKQIFSILKRMDSQFGHLNELEFNNTNSSQNSFCELFIADSLLLDFLENGYLARQSKEYVKDSIGETNWEKTINEGEVFFSQDYPIYAYPYNEIAELDESHLLLKIHKKCLLQCYTKYSELLDLRIYFPDTISESLEELGDRNYLLNFLKSTLSHTYVDRDIRTIKLLIQFINSTYSIGLDNYYYLFGTTSYHVAWELICRETIPNKTTELKKLISRPIWQSSEGVEHKETIVPDILASDEGSYFLIIDAKYYNINIQSRPFKIENTPGVNDVLKQFAYEVNFDNYCRGLGISNRFNVFLFPTEEKHEKPLRKIGEVTFREVFPGRKIYLLAYEDHAAYNNFIDGNKIEIEEILNRL